MRNILNAHYVFLFAVFISTASFGEEDSCKRLSTPRDVALCVSETHPSIIRARLTLKQTEGLAGVARQRPNPELASKTLFGVSNQNGIGAEVDLAQPLELGGKRKWRLERARAENAGASADLRLVREEVFTNTLLALYRLRQINAELHVLEETIDTYDHIQKQFKRRPQLSPEQEVSFSVFHLAHVDTELQKTTLQTEKNGLLRSLRVALGKDFKVTPSLLPPRLNEWPNLAPKETQQSALLQSAAADLKKAEAELGAEQSQSWPDVRLGPSYEGAALGDNGSHSVGFNLALPLPLLQRNQAGQAVAQQGIANARTSLDLRKREIELERETLLEQYLLATTALKAAFSHAEVEKKHRKTENLFARGFLPSALVIEVHRQMVDFVRHQNEQELTAIEAKWRLHALDGRLFEETL